jgi:FkbM family methyltransferase
MPLLRTIRFITSHPLSSRNKVGALIRFLKWQLRSRISSKPYIFPFVEGTCLVVEKGMVGATGNIYTGLHEFCDMGFLLHYLRKEDLFIDIGANIGSYTILAAGVRKTETIAVEPSSNTFRKLKRNIDYNNINTIVSAYNIGLGSDQGVLHFTKSFDAVNHVVVDRINKIDTEEIGIETLDNLLPEIYKPTLIKIDVEGFETEVINGATSTLKNHFVKAIIIELNGSGWRYGYDENHIHHLLITYGFKPYAYNPFTRKLTKLEVHGSENTMYVRDIEFVEERLTGSSKVIVLNVSF